tara:strand:+ start:1457 stop:1741 length:285 start_codon:yes stop_codon:yes gene_type:complete
MTVKQVFNKPWKNDSFHATFEEADTVRKKLINIWSENKEHEGMQAKVKRLSDRYVVKTRLHPDFDIKEEKKNGKGKRRNKKNSSRGKSDTPPVI